MERRYTEETFYFDHQQEAVQKIIREFDSDDQSLLEKVAGLYLKIRDQWRYNAYAISVRPENYRASFIAEKDNGHCIDKSILMIACLRAIKVPARLRLAKVQNHIAVEKLEEKFGTNVMTPHGMVELQIDGKWLKATPAFNKELCERTNVEPLHFDGKKDSIFQQFNSEGHAFMEYLEDYGYFDDVPVEFIKQNMAEHYPGFIGDVGSDGYLRLAN